MPTPTPTERDVIAVEAGLAALYATLSPAQQEVLDTVIAAGLSLAEADDTGGYVMGPSQFELEHHIRDRVAELREDFRRANAAADARPGDVRPRRWNLKPLLEWVSRPQPRAS